MHQQNLISKMRVGILLFFLFPLKCFSQDISGVWVGYMYNDTTQQTIHYELAINHVNGKTSGFSHITFIIDSVKNIGVKEVKVRVKDEHVYVEDEKFLYDDYTEPAAKGVKMFSFLTLSKNDSAYVLSGIWRTNATRKYNPLTGSIFLLKKKNVEPQQTLIVKKLIELGLAGQLTFLPSPVASQNDVAVNNKRQAASATSSEVTSLAEAKRKFAQPNNVRGNEQGVAGNEANGASKNNASSAFAAEPKQVQKDAENKGAVHGKSNSGVDQPFGNMQNKNAVTAQSSTKESNENAVAINQTSTSHTKQVSPTQISSNTYGVESDQSTTAKGVKESRKSIDPEQRKEKTVAINQSTQTPQNNNTSGSAITSNTNGTESNKSITVNEIKVSAKSHAKDLNEKTGLNHTTQTAQNKNTPPAPITSNTEGEESNKSITNSQVKGSAKPTDTKETNNNGVVINEHKIAGQHKQAPDNTNSPEAGHPVFENSVENNEKTASSEVAGKVQSQSESSSENKIRAVEKQVATNQKVDPEFHMPERDTKKKSSSTLAETGENISQQKVNTKASLPNEESSSRGTAQIPAIENKAEDRKQTEAINQQQKVKINPLSNQQKPNTLESTVVIKPKVVTPPAAADLAKRELETIRTVDIAQDSLVLSLYDNGSIDGDTVSVLMNGKVIMPRIGLLATAISKTVYLTPEMGDSVSVVMYAENLGSIPPNTGLLVIHDGAKIYEIRFSGDLNKNSKIILVRKKKT